MKLLAAALPLALSLAPSLASANPTEPFPLTGHRELSEEQRHLPRSFFGGIAPEAPKPLWSLASRPTVRREVYAYLPYWAYTSTTPYVAARWDLITVVAWFSVEMNASGNATTKNGWGNATTRAIVQDLQARGIKVTVTITNFSANDIASIVGSNRQNAINTCIALMEELNADGVNIDFETVPASARNNFVTFMTQLKDAIAARRPNGHEGHVTLAGPAVDWNSAYDFDVLLENTDGIMVMAYDYHWGGGSPGPSAPLYSASGFSNRSVSWTIDDYLTYGEWENRSKIIIGLPWYGRQWQVQSATLPATKVANGTTLTYKVAEPQALTYGKQWHDVMRTVYFHKTESGKTYQAWYDDARAFKERVAYVDSMDLGGIGIWALGYEGSDPALWNAIDSVLGAGSVVEPGDTDTDTDTDTEPMDTDTDTDTEPGATDTDTDTDTEPSSSDTDTETDTDHPGQGTDVNIGPGTGTDIGLEPPEKPNQPNQPEHPDGTTPAYPERPTRSVSSAESITDGGCQGGGGLALSGLALLALARLRRSEAC